MPAWHALFASCANRASTPIGPRSRPRWPTPPNGASSPPRSKSTSATASAWRDGSKGRSGRPAGRGAVSGGRPGTGGGRRRSVDHARPRLRGDALQPADADHRGQRGSAAARVDVLDRRPGRSRGPAARRGSYAVCRDPVPERAVRLRPHAPGLSAQVEVPPRRGSQRGGHRLLRRDQPRSVLRRREDRLQSAGRPHRRDRHRHRERTVEDEDRRSVAGRDHPRRPVHREASRDRRRVRRRVRHPRLGEGARSAHRPARVDRLQHGPGQRDAGVAGDGAAVWAYQFTPHDNWDYDANAEMILADLTVGGEERNVLVHFDKNGFAYTLDRATGEVLVAEPFVHVSWATHVDRASGRPVVDSTKLTGASRGNVKDICPSLEGGKTPAAPAAYSARTGLFYVPTNNLCMDYE